MSVFCQELLVRLADLMGSLASFREIAAACGISESSLYKWRAACERDRKANDLSSPYLIAFRGETMWWTEACAMARAEHLCSAESVIRAQAVDGIKHPVRDANQQIVYAKDPRFIGRSDDWVMLDTGCDAADVEWHRLLKGPDGLPVPETRVEQVPAPIRLAVLRAADPSYREHTVSDVNVSAEIVHTQKPMLRKPNEPAVNVEELRALARMSPEQRRAKLGASPYPLDQHGRRAMPMLSPPLTRDQPDDAGNGLRPVPEFVRPQQPASPVLTEGKPSYAKPSKNLDHSGVGVGTPPPGGFKVA